MCSNMPNNLILCSLFVSFLPFFRAYSFTKMVNVTRLLSKHESRKSARKLSLLRRRKLKWRMISKKWKRWIFSTRHYFVYFEMTKDILYPNNIVSQAAMKAYMRDLQENPDLSSQSSGSSTIIPVPPVYPVERKKTEWHEAKTSDGEVYYWHSVTGGTYRQPTRLVMSWCTCLTDSYVL